MMLIYLMMTAMVIVMVPRMTACLKRIEEVLNTVPEMEDATETHNKVNVKNPRKIVF